MNKVLTIIFIFISFQTVKAQTVGINTENPQGILHVDPKGDTSGTLNGTDDVIVKTNALTGIGTTTPTANLHLVGDMKIADGTQAANLILTCDENGNSKWSRKLLYTKVEGDDPHTILPSYKVDAGTTDLNKFKYMGISITLPPGKWQVFFTASYLNTTGATSTNIWWDLSSSKTSNNVQGGRVLSNAGTLGGYMTVTGIYFVSPTVTSTYYIFAVGGNFAANTSATYSGEGRFYALAVK